MSPAGPQGAALGTAPRSVTRTSRLGRLGDAALLLGLLALLCGREAVQLDHARSDLLLNAAGAAIAADAEAQASAAWEAGRAPRAVLARSAIAAGQAALLAGLVLLAWSAPDGVRWVWRALLGWCLLLLFVPHGALGERLR